MTKTARILIWTLSIAWILWMVPLFCSSATTAEKQYSVTIHIQKTGVTLAEALRLAEKYSKDGAEVTIQPVKCFGGNENWERYFIQDNCSDSLDSAKILKIGEGVPEIEFYGDSLHTKKLEVTP